MKLNKLIDHTLLKQDATRNDIKKLCEEAREYDFASVCINPIWVSYAKSLLLGTDVMICTVIGFPLGAQTTKTKAFETRDAIENGCDEIDMVINVGALIDGEYDTVLKDIEAVVLSANGKCVKVIIETCLLNDKQKIIACELVIKSGATFIKTSTGFSTGGATIEDVKLFKENIENECLIKAAGGVRSYSDLINMVNAGANRIGTSGGIKIISGENHNEKY